METVIDPQAIGQRDDGSESGIVRAEVAAGNLVPVPFKPNNCNIANTGTTSCFINASNTQNYDGTPTGIFCIVPFNSVLGSGARIGFFFSGSTLALRYSGVSGYAMPLLSVSVDGINYDLPSAQITDPINNVLFTTPPAELQHAVINRNLGQGEHFCEIFVNQSATTDARAFIHGFLVDESAGYSKSPVGLRAGANQITVGTSYGAINGTTNASITAIRKLFFMNPTGGAITVSVRSSSASTSPFWVKSIAASDTAEIDFGALNYDIYTMQVLGSASGVICSLLGAQ